MDHGCQSLSPHFTDEEIKLRQEPRGCKVVSVQFHQHLCAPTRSPLCSDGGEIGKVTACPTQAPTLSSPKIRNFPRK